jgi:hypothetical protein
MNQHIYGYREGYRRSGPPELRLQGFYENAERVKSGSRKKKKQDKAACHDPVAVENSILAFVIRQIISVLSDPVQPPICGGLSLPGHVCVCRMTGV